MYSQVKQDEWVLSLFPKGHKGTFLDIGCNHPVTINNTLLLEKNGWTGFAFDKENYRKAWKARSTPFIQTDVLEYDFKQLNLPTVIDYLSLDVDDLGTNYRMMKTLLEFGLEFKAITIEHNLYIGEHFNQQERLPQRTLLSLAGYQLAVPDVVSVDGLENKFEDWWINPKYL